MARTFVILSGPRALLALAGSSDEAPSPYPVNPKNAAEILALPEVDGALVGGASLDIRGFFEIVSRSRSAAV